MRRIIHALLAGSLAFGLVAASASGATFVLTLEDVVRVGTVDAAASVTFVDRACDNTYEIFWEVVGLEIVGFSAYREYVEPELDEGLAFCAGQPFNPQISDGMGGWLEPTLSSPNPKVTDAQGGILGAQFDEPIQFFDGDQVRLVIGPDAATY